MTREILSENPDKIIIGSKILSYYNTACIENITRRWVKCPQIKKLKRCKCLRCHFLCLVRKFSLIIISCIIFPHKPKLYTRYQSKLRCALCQFWCHHCTMLNNKCVTSFYPTHCSCNPLLLRKNSFFLNWKTKITFNRLFNIISLHSKLFPYTPFWASSFYRCVIL